MQNIPTELLRTLIAVVDMRSFTKAAVSLGVTQPAVSSQIKRLQQLLGGELFDRSAPGVSLTEKGVRVVNYARRLLAINDQIYGLAVRQEPIGQVRVGIPIDIYNNTRLFEVFARFRERERDLRLQITADNSDSLQRALREGLYEITLTRTDGARNDDAHFSWLERMIWMGRDQQFLDEQDVVPLVVLGESMGRRLGIAALEQANKPYDIVFVARTFAAMAAAAKSGLGVLVCSKVIGATQTDLAMCEESTSLPRIPDVRSSIHVRNELKRSAIDQLADEMAATLTEDENVTVLTNRQAAVR